MRTILIGLIFISGILGAQIRGVYKYDYKIDSTKMDSVQTEWMYLDINKEGSNYYSKKAFESDSISAEEVKKQIASGSGSISITKKSPGGQLGERVEKVYPGQIYLLTSVGSNSYKVKEDRNIEWQIQNETKTINDFNVQKATTNFAGRKWTAWFTAEVPFSDGPYKFSGLPGLIVQLEDQTQSHVFELKALEKRERAGIAEVSLPDGSTLDFFSKKALNVDRDQYKKILDQYRKDPVQGMRQTLSTPNTSVVININGQKYSDPAEVLRQMEKIARQKLKSRNNTIELEN